MDCKKHILISIFFISLLWGKAVLGIEHEIYELHELTVMSFQNRDISLEHTEDDMGVRLIFTHWIDEYLTEIQRSLSRTNVNYKLLPMRQAQMTVELFSPNRALRYKDKIQGRNIQIIIGSLRPHLDAINILLDSSSTVPLDEETALELKEGTIANARQNLLSTQAETHGERLLLNARMSVMNAALRGGKAVSCEPFPNRHDLPHEFESSLLTAFCLNSMGRADLADELLNRVINTNDGKELRQRASQQQNNILLKGLLNGERYLNYELTAGLFGEHVEDIIKENFSTHIIEVIVNSLVQLGLTSLLTKVADKMISRFSDDYLQASIAAFAKAYLHAGEYVKARDAVSYYLNKKLPPWSSARLHKIQGHVLLQEGNWFEAKQFFEAAYSVMPFSFEDQVALFESNIRLGIWQPEILFKPDPLKNNSAVNKIYSDLYSTLLLKQALMTNESFNEIDLDRLSDYDLYYAAEYAKISNKKRAIKILNILKKRKSNWAFLANVELETQTAIKKLNFLKKEIFK